MMDQSGQGTDQGTGSVDQQNSAVKDTINQIRELLQNGDTEGATAALDQLEQQIDQEETTEEQPSPEGDSSGGMPDSVQRFAGMKQ